MGKTRRVNVFVFPPLFSRWLFCLRGSIFQRVPSRWTSAWLRATPARWRPRALAWSRRATSPTKPPTLMSTQQVEFKGDAVHLPSNQVGNESRQNSMFDLLLLKGAGVGEVEVEVMDPAGKKNTVPCTIEDKGNSSYRCTYKPTQEGQHTIFITFAGGQISKSPFTVDVGEGESLNLVTSHQLLFQHVDCNGFPCEPSALIISSWFLIVLCLLLLLCWISDLLSVSSPSLLFDSVPLASVHSWERPLPSAVISCFLASLLGTHCVSEIGCMRACGLWSST